MAGRFARHGLLVLNAENHNVTPAVTFISNGGIEVVDGGGKARSLIIGSGGIDVVVSGGTESATTINSGGIDIVVSGTASGATVGSGGFELVDSGSIDSAATISGGTFDVASGGSTGSGPVTFASSAGGTLQLDASVSFGGLVAGFGAPDHLDLADIAFGSGMSVSFAEASNNSSGTLTVTDGTHTANITLLGQYMAGQFTLASDGHGGTVIGDPPVVAGDESAALVAPHHA